MVKGYRVDDRLLHGLVQLKWLGLYKANRVIIISDAAANDPLTVKVLKVSKPANVELVISNDAKGAAYLKKDAQQENARTFVIFKTIEAALRVMEEGIEIGKLIVGPVSSKPGAEVMNKQTYFTKEELRAARKLSTAGCEIVFQLTPDETKIMWDSIKDKYEEDSQ